MKATFSILFFVLLIWQFCLACRSQKIWLVGSLGGLVIALIIIQDTTSNLLMRMNMKKGEIVVESKREEAGFTDASKTHKYLLKQGDLRITTTSTTFVPIDIKYDTAMPSDDYLLFLESTEPAKIELLSKDAKGFKAQIAVSHGTGGGFRYKAIAITH